MKLWLNIFLINIINGNILSKPKFLGKSLPSNMKKSLKSKLLIFKAPKKSIIIKGQESKKNKKILLQKFNKKRKNLLKNNENFTIDPIDMLKKYPKSSAALLLASGITLGFLTNDMINKKNIEIQKKNLNFDPDLVPKIDINQPVDKLTQLMKAITQLINNYKKPENVQLRHQFNNLFHNKNTTFFRVFQNILSSKTHDYDLLKKIAIKTASLMDITNTFVDNKGNFDVDSLLNILNNNDPSLNPEKGVDFLLFMNFGSSNTILNLLKQLDKFTSENMAHIKGLYKNNEEENLFEYKLLKIIQQTINTFKNVKDSNSSIDWKTIIKITVENIAQDLILFIHNHTDIAIIKILQEMIDNYQRFLSTKTIILLVNQFLGQEANLFKDAIINIITTAYNNIKNKKLDQLPRNPMVINNNLMYFFWKFGLSFLKQQNIDNKKIFTQIKSLKNQFRQLTHEDYMILYKELSSLVPSTNIQGKPLEPSIVNNEVIASYLQYQKTNFENIITILEIAKELIETSFKVLLPLIEDNLPKHPVVI